MKMRTTAGDRRRRARAARRPRSCRRAGAAAARRPRARRPHAPAASRGVAAEGRVVDLSRRGGARRRRARRRLVVACWSRRDQVRAQGRRCWRRSSPTSCAPRCDEAAARVAEAEAEVRLAELNREPPRSGWWPSRSRPPTTWTRPARDLDIARARAGHGRGRGGPLRGARSARRRIVAPISGHRDRARRWTRARRWRPGDAVVTHGRPRPAARRGRGRRGGRGRAGGGRAGRDHRRRLPGPHAGRAASRRSPTRSRCAS